MDTENWQRNLEMGRKKAESIREELTGWWPKIAQGWDGIGGAAELVGNLGDKSTLSELGKASQALRAAHLGGHQVWIAVNQALDHQLGFEGFLASAANKVTAVSDRDRISALMDIQAGVREEYSHVSDSIRRQREELGLLYESLMERYEAKRTEEVNRANWILTAFGVILTAIATAIALAQF